MSTIETKSENVPKATKRHSFSIKSRATLVVNLEELAEPAVALPPDGGWGWVVVGASLFIMFCVDGIAFCFALFFEELSRTFNCEETDIAVISSVLGGFYFISAIMKPKISSLKSAAAKSSELQSRIEKSHATKSFLINIQDLGEPTVTLPPDGGWGWVIVVTSFIMMFCLDGIGYCFAIFFQELSSEFKCREVDVAIVASLIGGFYYLAGPLTCSAVNRLGFQVIAVLGGAMALIAFFVASLVDTLLPFLLIIGILGGTAFNLMYTPSIIAIGFYFERWRALAIAICCCGSSLGVMCFPIIAVHVFGDMLWRTKFKILAGIFGFCGILGLSFRPLKSVKVERTVQFGEVSQMNAVGALDTETELGTGIVGFLQRFRNVLFPTISEVSFYSSRQPSLTSSIGYSYYVNRGADEEALSTYIRPETSALDLVGETIVNQPDGDANINSRDCCMYFRKLSHCCNPAHEASYSTVNRPLYRDDIFYSGSVFTLPQYSKRGESRASVPAQKITPSLAYTLSVSRAPTQRDLEQQYQCVCCPEAFVRVLATMLHFHMLKSPTFIILLFSGYLSLMGTYIVYTYIPSYAREHGVDQSMAAMLLSVIGIANTLGRAACGIVSCMPFLDANLVSWITISISGLAVVFYICVYSATSHIIISVIFGFNLASFAVLRAIIFVDLFGLENLTNCFGLHMIFQSMAAFSATPIANLILHYTDSFTIVFIFTGVSIFFSGVLLIPLKYILKLEKQFHNRVTFG